MIIMRIREKISIRERIGISSFGLKVIACLTMLIDHIGGIVVYWNIDFSNLANDPSLYLIYSLTRMIGRISFPIFAFLIVEGFIHTKNFKKYISRMFIFALISIIPYNLAFGRRVFNPQYWTNFIFGNVLWTFLVGLVLMYLLKIVEEKKYKKIVEFGLYIVLTAVFMVIAYFIKCDRRQWGILVIALFYIFRDSRWKQALTSIVSFRDQPLISHLALIPILLYNGERGRDIRYFFYIFYPLHLIVLYFISINVII